MTATTRPTAPVRAFLRALATGAPARPTNPTIDAALKGGWVVYSEGERVCVNGSWRTVGQGYSITAAGRAVMGYAAE